MSPTTEKAETSVTKPALTSRQITFLLLVITAALPVVCWMTPDGVNWALTVVLMVIFLMVIGIGISGRPLGVLINERKLMSLSRFQVALWTVIVLAGYLVIVIARVKQGDVADPLIVQIDWQVWTLLGISTTALVGSPLISAVKRQKKPDEKEADIGVKALQDAYGKDQSLKANSVGLLYTNKTADEARFTDMFESDEFTHTMLIDLGKVQMFFFTVVAAIAFSGELLHVIVSTDLFIDNVAMPSFPEGLLTLMGISNAGYLGAKGVTQTKTKPAGQ